VATIREHARKNGTSYYVMFRLGKKQASKAFETRKAAEKFKAAVEAVGAAVAVEMLDARRSSRSVDSLFVEWLEHKRSEMTKEAHRDYERAYEKWIKKQIGWRDAELVTERDVQTWVDKTLRPSLGAKSVLKQHALLHGMFAWASSKTVGYIANDPCKETNLPDLKKRPPRGLTLPELHAMLAVAPAVKQADAADVIAVMAGTGWRPQEVLGLLAGSIEVMPDGNVYATVSTVYRRGEGIVEDGKTEAAGRRIRVLGEGPAVLARRIVGRGINDPVFPHPKTGKPWRPASFSRDYWPKVVAAAGLSERRPTPYWLRHTHVAICHAAGLTLPEIQRRIGHEHISTTIDVYGRMIDGMSDDTARRLDALLKPGALPAVVTGSVVEPDALPGEVVLDGTVDDR
jgi:site-specific recombinase XerD